MKCECGTCGSEATHVVKRTTSSDGAPTYMCGRCAWSVTEIDANLASEKLTTQDSAQYIRDHVVHCKRDHYDVYIGRGSKWGNPFIIGCNGDRDEVIAKYEKHLLNSDRLWSSLYELKGKVLGCWCSPAHCHGHLLVQYAGRAKDI